MKKDSTTINLYIITGYFRNYKLYDYCIGTAHHGGMLPPLSARDCGLILSAGCCLFCFFWSLFSLCPQGTSLVSSHLSKYANEWTD